MSKSIAEILGWIEDGTWWLDEPDGTAEVSCWKRPNSMRTYREPTVDDMLTWLKAQDRAVNITGGQPNTYWQVRITNPGDYQQHVLFSRSHNAPTLHAALEAAVRAIDEAKP